jgi:hypothetical protein
MTDAPVLPAVPVFRAVNPDGSDPGAEFVSWTLTQYIDKYHQFDGTAPEDVPLIVGGWLDISFGTEIIFRGYLDSIERTEGQIRCTYYDLRKSLEDVYAQLIEYPDGYTVNDILSSDPPAAGRKPGLLWLLNSAVPQGAFEHYSGEIYVLRGAGTNSRCGTADVYQESRKLSPGAGRDTLQRGQYWRDENDLYVRCTDGRDPRYWLMSIANYRDTRIRLGNIKDGTTTFEVPYRVKKATYRDAIEPLLNAMGLEMYLEHRPPGPGETLGISYLHAVEMVGRGSASEPVAYYGESALSGGAILVAERSTGQEEFSAVIGAGPGRGYSQITAARANFRRRGHWKETLYTTSLLGELLERSLDRIWNDQTDARCWEVEDVDDLARRPGDWVEIRPPKSSPLVKRVKKVVHRSNGTMILEINQRRLDPEDLMRSRAQLIDDMMSYVSNQVTSWSTSFGPTNVDDSDPGPQIWSGAAKFELEIPEGTIDWSFPFRFMLTFTVCPYEDSTESVHAGAHNHGGVTGGHGGYGGQETSAAAQHPHTTNQTTSLTSGLIAQAISDLSTEEVGDHTHSPFVGTAGAHTHGLSAVGELCQTEVTGSLEHSHSYLAYMPTETSTDGDHPHECDYGGEHWHDLDFTGDELCTEYAAGHCHYYSDIYVGAIYSDGDHAHDIDWAGSHTHEVFWDDALFETEFSGTMEHSHTYVDRCPTSTDSEGSHDHPCGSFGAGRHRHALLATQRWFAMSDHYHRIPSVDTTYNGGDPHLTPVEAAKTRAVFTEPISEAIMTSFKKLLDTGNSTHLLDVSVKVNGDPGTCSPFT